VECQLLVGSTAAAAARGLDRLYRQSEMTLVRSITNSSRLVYRLSTPGVVLASKPKFHGSSFLVASSSHPRRHAWRPREDATRISARVGRLDRSACRALTWLVGRRSAAVYGAARLSVCRVVLEIPPAQHARLERILVASSSDTSTRSISSWHVTRKRGSCSRGIPALQAPAAKWSSSATSEMSREQSHYLPDPLFTSSPNDLLTKLYGQRPIA